MHKVKYSKEDLKFYYKVNVGLSAVEEIRKKFISSSKYNTILIPKVDVEIFLQNILLALENVQDVIDGYVIVKERLSFLNDLYVKASERENFFFENWMEDIRRKEGSNE